MALFSLELTLCLVFSTVVLAMIGYICLFVWLFHLRRQQFGFQNRRGGLTELSAFFAVIYWSQRVSSVWLALTGATRAAQSGQSVSIWKLILILTYDVLNPLSILGVGLTISLRIWLVFYDLNMALNSGDERWTSMIEHYRINVEDYKPSKSGSTRSSSGIVSSFLSNLTNRLLSVGTGSTPRSVRSDGLTPRMSALSPTNWRRKSTGFIHMSSIHKVEPTVLKTGVGSGSGSTMNGSGIGMTAQGRSRAQTDQGLSPIISPITPVFAESDALREEPVEPLSLDPPLMHHNAGALSAPLPTFLLKEQDLFKQKSDTTGTVDSTKTVNGPVSEGGASIGTVSVIQQANSLSLEWTEEEKTSQLKSEFPNSRPASLLSIVSSGKTKSQVSWGDETVIVKETTIDDAELDELMQDGNESINSRDTANTPKRLQLRLDQGSSLEEEKQTMMLVVQDEDGVKKEQTINMSHPPHSYESGSEQKSDGGHQRLSLPIPPEDDVMDEDDYEDEDALSIISDSQPKIENWYFKNKQTYGSFDWVFYRVYLPCYAALFLSAFSLRFLSLFFGSPFYSSLVTLVFAAWLLVSFSVGFLIYFQFPRYHDSLLLFDELTFISVLTLASLLSYLPFSVLLISGKAKEGQFYFELVLSFVVVLDSFAITMVQTHWVLHTFQNKKAYLKNTDIYKPTGLMSEEESELFGLRDDDDSDGKDSGICYYMLCCMDLAVEQMHGRIRQIRDLHRSHSFYGWAGGALTLIGVRSKSSTEVVKTTSSNAIIAANMYGEMSTTTASQSSKNQVTMQMRAVLSDETALRLFMAHLFSEMAYESLLAIIELVAFTKYLLRKNNALTPHGIHIIPNFNADDAYGPDQMTNDDLAFTRRVLIDFPANVERLRSSIVFHKNLTIQQKYLALCDKYIRQGAPMAVNISHECRFHLISFAERVKRNQWMRYRANMTIDSNDRLTPTAISTVPKSGSIDSAMNSVTNVETELPIQYDVFFDVILQVQRLLRDSYVRFQRTERMQKLMVEAPYLFDL